jgi:hypothetical protein
VSQLAESGRPTTGKVNVTKKSNEQTAKKREIADRRKLVLFKSGTTKNPETLRNEVST